MEPFLQAEHLQLSQPFRENCEGRMLRGILTEPQSAAHNGACSPSLAHCPPCPHAPSPASPHPPRIRPCLAAKTCSLLQSPFVTPQIHLPLGPAGICYLGLRDSAGAAAVARRWRGQPRAQDGARGPRPGGTKMAAGSGAAMAAEAERASRPGTAAGSAQTTRDGDCPGMGSACGAGVKGGMSLSPRLMSKISFLPDKKSFMPVSPHAQNC